MKKNNKGYLVIEIILAIMLTMMIISVVLTLVIKLNNKNEDLSLDTVMLNDKETIISTIRSDLNNYLLTNINQKDENIVCFTFDDSNREIKKLLIVDKDNNTIEYGNTSDESDIDKDDNYFMKELNKNAIIGDDSIIKADSLNKIFQLNIPITVNKSDKDYSINLYLNKENQKVEFIGYNEDDVIKYINEYYLEFTPSLIFTFGYTLLTDTVKVTLSPGIYYFQLWGADGGGTESLFSENKATQGYASGFYDTGETNDFTFYAYMGGAGKSSSGGFNGGGTPNGSDSYGGGGASHIALVDGELSTLENKKEQVLLVAGGGGGISTLLFNRSSDTATGTGGGYYGGDGSIIYNDNNDDINVVNVASGGSQSSGGKGAYITATFTRLVTTSSFPFIKTEKYMKNSKGTNGSFGQGGSGNTTYGGAGGGGGYYGGGGGAEINKNSDIKGSTAGGGSGYISDKFLYGYTTITSLGTLINDNRKPTTSLLCTKHGGCMRIWQIFSYVEVENPIITEE